MDDFKKRWGVFLSLIFDPWVILLTVALGLLFWQGPKQSGAGFGSIVFVMITLASAVLGGRITKQWVDVTEGGVVIARGKSAVRGLMLLLRNIASLERRVVRFLESDEGEEEIDQVTARNYEEIVEFCSLLQEETVNSIENWTDILPEADIASRIGVITDLRLELESAGSELGELQSELDQAKDSSEMEKQALKKQIGDQERRISGLRSQIVEKQVFFSGVSSVDSFATTVPPQGYALLAPGITGSKIKIPGLFGSEAIPEVPDFGKIKISNEKSGEDD